MDIRKRFFQYSNYKSIPFIPATVILARTTQISFASGLILILLGEAVRLWAVAHAGYDTRVTGRVGCRRLVTDGPFELVRNPLRRGNILPGLGF